MVNAQMLGRSQARGHWQFMVRSLLFLVAVGVVVALLVGPLMAGFSANVYLNGTIVAALLFGIAYTLIGLTRVALEARAIDRAGRLVEQAEHGGHKRAELTDILVRLRPRAIGEFLETVQRVVSRGESSATLPYLLDSLATRAEDRRALVRFLTGALILLGLIGTFYGLLLTIGGVKEVLAGLTAEPGADTTALLTSLRERLALPMGGMALAFSSSLFGLSASLILAFLELQLFHAQSAVHARMESLVVSELLPFWGMRGSTRAEPPGAASTGYIEVLLQNTAEHLERVALQLEDAQRATAGTERLGEATARLAEQLATLGATLERLEAERTGELRNELRLLTKTLAQRGSYAASS